jgi:hypothetical protein
MALIEGNGSCSSVLFCPAALTDSAGGTTIRPARRCAELPTRGHGSPEDVILLRRWAHRPA